MRNFMRSLVLVVASLGLLGVGVPPAAEARTVEELNVCWVNKAPGEWLDLEVVVDGPSFKTASLDNKDCVAWDVRPGQYRLTVEDVGEFSTAMNAACGPKRDRRLTIFLKRQQDTYKTDFRALRTGGAVTNVRKDRRTTVTFVLTCVAAKT